MNTVKKALKLLYPLMPNCRLRKIILTMTGYKIGKDVHLPSCFKVSDLNTRRDNVIIGDRVSIGPDVLIVTDSSPNNSRLIKPYPMISKNVVIKNDVWLGARVVVLPGVKIGECSIIAAGSIVTKSIPDYSVAAGTPARVIKQINPDEL